MGRLARLAARAFLLGSLLLASGCETIDTVVGDSALPPAEDARWQVLPMRRFLTRPTIRVEAMEFCRRDRCGYDAALARFAASGAEAAALHRDIADPAALAALVRRPRPNVTHKPAAVAVTPWTTGAWKGVMVSLADPATKKAATGVAIERPGKDGRTFVLVVAGSPAVAQRLAQEAAR